MYKPEDNKEESHRTVSDVIDADQPWSEAEVEKSTSHLYVESLTRPEAPHVAADFCPLGDRACKRFAKLGMCKTPECPLVAKERRMAMAASRPKSLIDLQSDYLDVDMPFSTADLEEATSPLYIECLSQSGLPSPFRRPF